VPGGDIGRWIGLVTGPSPFFGRRTARTSRRAGFPSFVSRLPITRRALEFARLVTPAKRREADQAAFILHPLGVAQLLRGRSYPDRVVAAGVLHDVIEDTDVGFEELEQQFGVEVASLVRAVSEPPGGSDYAEGKARLRRRR
jgi:(p)ppGpp synthase/HD superfamily hydrolase